MKLRPNHLLHNGGVIMEELSARDERRDLLTDLYRRLAMQDDAIALYTLARDTIRNEIATIVAEVGEAVVLPGLARMEITAPSIVVSYDKRKVDDVAREMANEGMASWVQKLLRCQKETMRAGSLRITKEKRG